MSNQHSQKRLANILFNDVLYYLDLIKCIPSESSTTTLESKHLKYSKNVQIFNRIIDKIVENEKLCDSFAQTVHENFDKFFIEIIDSYRTLKNQYIYFKTNLKLDMSEYINAINTLDKFKQLRKKN